MCAGVPRLLLPLDGTTEQRCTHPVMWWTGQALAGARLEDGLDPDPRPWRCFWQRGENAHSSTCMNAPFSVLK